MNNNDIWSRVLEIIKKELNPVSFSTWFGETKFYEMNDQKVTLLVPMPLHKRILLSHYYKLLSDSFYTVTNVEREIDCILEDEIVKSVENRVEEVVNKSEVIDNSFENFDSNLNPNLTFDNFVVGNSNKFARTAAFAVAEHPGTIYNPLFIYGKSGIGKTHLMHAIGNYIVENNPKLRVLYTASEEFRNDYTKISNPSENAMDASSKFKNKYRNVDVLMIDDIQLILSATKTMEEFFHTFNELHRNNKQIIITSDSSQNYLKDLEYSLNTRFAIVLTVDIFPPDN